MVEIVLHNLDVSMIPNGFTADPNADARQNHEETSMAIDADGNADVLLEHSDLFVEAPSARDERDRAAKQVSGQLSEPEPFGVAADPSGFTADPNVDVAFVNIYIYIYIGDETVTAEVTFQDFSAIASSTPSIQPQSIQRVHVVRI